MQDLPVGGPRADRRHAGEITSLSYFKNSLMSPFKRAGEGHLCLDCCLGVRQASDNGGMDGGFCC